MNLWCPVLKSWFFGEICPIFKKDCKDVKVLDCMKELKIPTSKLLTVIADSLEPKTHCCECTPGEHFERHLVHIQYPDCNCNPEKYILKRND